LISLKFLPFQWSHILIKSNYFKYLKRIFLLFWIIFFFIIDFLYLWESQSFKYFFSFAMAKFFIVFSDGYFVISFLIHVDFYFFSKWTLKWDFTVCKIFDFRDWRVFKMVFSKMFRTSMRISFIWIFIEIL